MAKNQNTKKRILEQDLETELRTGFNFPSENENWQRFIVLESLTDDMPLTKLSPFAIHKGITGIAGTVKDIKKLRSGQILVECARKANSENLLQATTLAGITMKAFPHSTLNNSKGVIRTRELQDMDESEIALELKPIGVIDVKRIIIKKDGQMIKTGTYILTFNRPQPPEKIKLGYLSVAVDIFIPNPLRCFKCQKFGHGSAGCKNKTTCQNCGEDDHGMNCTKPPKCKNCLGDHAASSKNCPIWHKEKEIQKIKHTRKMSYPEARKIVEALPAFCLKKPYSVAVTPKTQSISCQTDLTWLFKDKPQTISNTKNSTSQKTKNELIQTGPIQDSYLEQKESKVKKKTPSTTNQQPNQDKCRTHKDDNPKDIEMTETTTSRSRSLSPKCKNKGPVPIFPT